MVKSKLLSSALHAFWEYTGCEQAVRKALMMLLFIGLMVVARTASAQITVDGNPADWPAGVFSNPSVLIKTFVVDSVDANDDVFKGGGSKDVNPISSWQWEIQSTNDKTDMENAGMALIGHKLYFFGDRLSTDGDASIGIWILKNQVNKLPIVSGTGTFSNTHVDGDVLVTMQFTGGGGHPERHIYKWLSGGLVEVTLSVLAADVAVNQTNVYPAPWAFHTKDTTPVNVYTRNSFFEGFVDVDSLGVGVDVCFSEFFMSTRTSQSTNAILMDLVQGIFATRPLVSVANDTVCAGQPAVFTAVVTGGLAPITYSWNGTAYAASNTFTINPATVNTVVTVIAKGTNGCLSEPDTAQLVVKPSPAVNPTSDRTHCNGATGAAISFTSNPPGATFNWTSSANVGFGTSGTVNPIPSYTATNTSTVTVTATVTVTPSANGCSGAPDTFLVTVYPTPVVAAHGDSSYCNGVNAPGLTFTGTPAGVTFNWTSSIDIGFGTSNSGNIPSYVATNTGTVAVTTTVIVTPSANGCTGRADTFLITVNPTPNVVAHGDSVYCPNVLAGAINFSGGVGGTTFNWTSSADVGFGTSGSTNIPAYLTVNGGGVPVVATVVVTPSANGCSGKADTFLVTVNPKPGPNAPVSNAVLCNGVIQDTIHLASLDPAVTTTWSINTNLGFGTGGAGNIPAFLASNPGTVPIVATVTVTSATSAGCASGDTSAFTITINPDAGANAPVGNMELCSGAHADSIDIKGLDNVTTFHWTSTSNVGFDTSGTGNIPPFTAITNPGPGVITATVTITAMSPSGCPGDTTGFTITIDPLPVLSAHDTSICAGNSVNLNLLSDPDGGTWTGTGVSGTTFNSVGLSAGAHGLLYTYTDSNSCTNTDSAYITILVNPTVVARDTAICAGVSFSLNLLSDPDGGTWSGTGVSGTTFNSAGLAPGTYGLLYTFSNGAGCTGSDSAYITIYANPVVTARDTAICSGVSFSLNLLSDPDGGTWSGPGVSGTTFNSNGLAAGVYGLLYTYTNGNGCSSSDSAYVTIYALPNVTARDTSICSGNSFSLNLLSDPDGGTWSGTGVSGTTFNSAGLSSGMYGLLYTYTNGNGCTSSDSAYVTILVNPTVVARDTAICAGVSFSLNLLSDPDGGTWSGTGVSGATFNSAGLAPGTYGLLYTFSNGVGCSGSDSAYITINANPVVTARDTAICAGVSFSLNLLSDPDGGTWSGTGASGTTFNSGGLAAGTYGLLYTYTNGSGCTSTDSAYVTIHANPTVTARDTAICAGNSFSLNLLSDPDGGTWSGAGVSGTTFNSVGLANGTYGLLYTYTNGYGCTGSDSAYVTIIANPTVTARDTSICAGASVNLNLLSDPDGGTWSGTGVSGTTFNSIGLPAGKYGLLYTLSSGGCGGSDSAYITIKPTPDVYPHGDSVYCKGIWAPGLNFAGSVPGTMFAWTSSSNVGFGSSGSGNIPGYLTLNPGSTNLVTTVVVTPSKYSCVGAKDTFLITIKPKPTIPYIPNVTVCSGGYVSLINITGGDLVNTYTWSGTLNVGFGTGGTGNINPFTAIVNNGPGNKVDTVTVSVTTTAGCPGDTKKFTVTVLPKLVVVAKDTVVCKGNSLNLTPLGYPAGGTWSGPGVSGSTFNSGALATGTYKIYYTVCANGCTAYDSAYICVTQCCVVYGTYTQGMYSSCYGTVCDGKGHNRTIVQLIDDLLNCGGGQITVGRPGRSVIVPTWAASILQSVLPSGYGPNKLVYAGNVTISNTPSSLFATKYLSGGKINNILMAQQIALKLNLRLSPGLSSFPIQYTPGSDSYFQTFNANGYCCVFTCGNTCPKCFCLKKSVTKFLTKGGTQAATVTDLMNLADDLLGGWLTPGTTVGGYIVPSYADVADAIATIHNAFDSFRTYNGSYGCSAGAKSPVANNITDEIPNLEALTRVYPNPTTGIFTIEVPAIEKDARVVVLDINGRTIVSTTLPASSSGQKLQLEMPDVSRGMYIIRIEHDGKAFSRKLMLE